MRWRAVVSCLVANFRKEQGFFRSLLAAGMTRYVGLAIEKSGELINRAFRRFRSSRTHGPEYRFRAWSGWYDIRQLPKDERTSCRCSTWLSLHLRNPSSPRIRDRTTHRCRHCCRSHSYGLRPKALGINPTTSLVSSSLGRLLFQSLTSKFPTQAPSSLWPTVTPARDHTPMDLDLSSSLDAPVCEARPLTPRVSAIIPGSGPMSRLGEPAPALTDPDSAEIQEVFSGPRHFPDDDGMKYCMA